MEFLQRPRQHRRHPQQLAEARAWAHERTLVNIDVGRSYLDGTSPFPERTAINILVGRFLDDFLETVDRWAQWATEATEEWPAHPGEAPVDAEALAATVRQAEERSSRWRAGPVQPPAREDLSCPGVVVSQGDRSAPTAVDPPPQRQAESPRHLPAVGVRGYSFRMPFR